MSLENNKEQNLSLKNLKIPQLKMPELKVKSHHYNTSYNELKPLIHEQKEVINYSYALSTNEEINNSMNETIHVSKSKNNLSHFYNLNGNEINKSPHKGNISPVLKRRKKNDQIDNNINIKRINVKSNFTKKTRTDYFGNEINHKNKRNVKITFRDEIDENNDLCDIIDVECVKEYIKVFGKVDRKDTYVREKVGCDCSCFVF
jgi:hypothetical protein